MTSTNGQDGRGDFVERHGLWDDRTAEAAASAERLVADNDIEIVRFSFADQHGILRGKSVMANAFSETLRNGCNIVSTLIAKDTAHRTIYPVFTPGAGLGIDELTGGGDIVMVPDPATIRLLPWSQGTAWVLCDLYFTNGRPVPLSSRQVLRDALSTLEAQGYSYMSGLEVEFHLFRLEDARLQPVQSGQPASPPEVSLLAHGFQHLTEIRLDELDGALTLIRQNLVALGLPLHSIEVEFGPAQCEATFEPVMGLGTADMMVLFRSAVKQICRRNGYHASFMCRPGLPNMFSAGWHLHQSLIERKTGRNAFMPANGNAPLSELGLQFAAGVLAHARPTSVFTTPTINGYKRFRPYSLAPDRAVWAVDSRGVMIRALGGGGPATRIENRVGEPAANPYLYMASQIHAGLDGIARNLDPGAPAEMPYETEAERLPKSLIEAVSALRESELFRRAFGAAFVDYIVTLKEAEIARFLSEVTDWEHREYFDVF